MSNWNSLAIESPGNEDSYTEESAVWAHHRRGGDVEPFFRHNPETILIGLEDEEINDEIRQEEIRYAEELVAKIWSRLTERQQIVWKLRAEGKTFKDIAQAINCSERCAYYDWKTIRKVVWQILRAE